MLWLWILRLLLLLLLTPIILLAPIVLSAPVLELSCVFHYCYHHYCHHYYYYYYVYDTHVLQALSPSRGGTRSSATRGARSARLIYSIYYDILDYTIMCVSLSLSLSSYTYIYIYIYIYIYTHIYIHTNNCCLCLYIDQGRSGATRGHPHFPLPNVFVEAYQSLPCECFCIGLLSSPWLGALRVYLPEGLPSPEESYLGWRFKARKRKVKPLRASQSLSETFPSTGYKAVSLKGTTLRGKRVARVGIWAH